MSAAFPHICASLLRMAGARARSSFGWVPTNALIAGGGPAAPEAADYPLIGGTCDYTGTEPRPAAVVHVARSQTLLAHPQVLGAATGSPCPVGSPTGRAPGLARR